MARASEKPSGKQGKATVEQKSDQNKKSEWAAALDQLQGNSPSSAASWSQPSAPPAPKPEAKPAPKAEAKPTPKAEAKPAVRAAAPAKKSPAATKPAAAHAAASPAQNEWTKAVTAIETGSPVPEVPATAPVKAAVVEPAPAPPAQPAPARTPDPVKSATAPVAAAPCPCPPAPPANEGKAAPAVAEAGRPVKAPAATQHAASEAPAADSPIIIRKAKPAAIQPNATLNAAIGRWFEVQSAALSTRYRYIDNTAGVITNNQMQHSEAFKARFKFDRQGKYSINAGLASGNNFTGGWNTTGVGTGTAYTNLFLKQLYAEAKPFKGLEVQFGGLGFNRGESTEITSWDNDAYMVGERVSLKSPKNLFFDEISATYAYVGDVNKPDLRKRFFRMQQSNYHQFLVAKKIGKRASLSFDYTFASGIETLRQAVKLNVKESHFLDTILFENYQRTDVKPDYGMAVYGEKALNKRLTMGAGFASIDRNYGGLNADRFNKGKRAFVSSKLTLTREFSVQTFYTRALWNDYSVSNRTRLDVIFSYDMLKSLQRTGLFVPGK